MIRFIFLLAGAFALLAVALPGAASAELIYYVEDFEHNGEPGFDPMFNHEFTADPGTAGNWNVSRWVGPSHPGECSLFLARTTDTITFHLPSNERIVFASVSLHDGLAPNTSVRFIGSLDAWTTGSVDYGKKIIEITAAQIGAIQHIELYSTQGIFLNITIGVVPEPTNTILLFWLITVAILRASGRRRKL